jgi:hypothetical protein
MMRVIKARHRSVCPICNTWIQVGQKIGQTPAGWACVACIIGAAANWARRPA